MRLDVLIFGGGAAGLWCLERFRRAGYHALLLESTALGAGQTIAAQGIIHGGGKYALRGVRDFAAVNATKAMPARWRASLAGKEEPDLRDARVLSESCCLWLPKGSALARLQSFGFMSVVARAGLLSTRPKRLPASRWPEALRGSAVAVYALAEPVISTGSLLKALSARQDKYIHRYDSAALRFEGRNARIGDVALEPRTIVLTAGAGNAELLARLGVGGEPMQRRPLGMVLLRGELPPLFGHCIVGGKTQLTITSPEKRIWQIGGEVAEKLAGETDDNAARQFALKEIHTRLPALDLTDIEIAIYRAVRAEARTADQRRPSGVHAGELAPGVIAGWPTKLSMAPVLADEVFALAEKTLKQPAGYPHHPLPPWPPPPVARYPWEDAEWFPAR
ncbi:MAG TPA: FAD-dependent oxidoreductase [Candidatus Binatia bacterium]|jgi:glycine/D-amino acid oxidase-like deaminating enzyme